MFNTKLKLIYLLHVQNVPAYAPRQQFLKKFSISLIKRWLNLFIIMCNTFAFFLSYTRSFFLLFRFDLMFCLILFRWCNTHYYSHVKKGIDIFTLNITSSISIIWNCLNYNFDENCKIFITLLNFNCIFSDYFHIKEEFVTISSIADWIVLAYTDYTDGILISCSVPQIFHQKHRSVWFGR